MYIMVDTNIVVVTIVSVVVVLFFLSDAYRMNIFVNNFTKAKMSAKN